MMGPMRGEMSMAPMMTAVEFTFKPTDATKMANIKIQGGCPDEFYPVTDAPLDFTIICLIFTKAESMHQERK
jgi:hypothetical protein